MAKLHGSKVDWVSFSVKMEGINDRAGVSDYVDAMADRHYRQFGAWFWQLIALGDWTTGKGRAPYAMSSSLDGTGITCYYNENLENCLWEISGTGCTFLRKLELLNPLLEKVKNNLTRLDLAVDFETDMSPKEFVSAGYSTKIKSTGYQESKTGQTVYVGSRTSQQFARVYRYNQPHKRAHLLRVEFQMKKKKARAIAQVMLSYGIRDAVQTISRPFAFKEKIWSLHSGDVVALEGIADDKQSASTMIWLMTQVKPAIQKLISNGSITDPEKWFLEEMLGKKSV